MRYFIFLLVAIFSMALPNLSKNIKGGSEATGVWIEVEDRLDIHVDIGTVDVFKSVSSTDGHPAISCEIGFESEPECRFLSQQNLDDGVAILSIKKGHLVRPSDASIIDISGLVMLSVAYKGERTHSRHGNYTEFRFTPAEMIRAISHRNGKSLTKKENYTEFKYGATSINIIDVAIIHAIENAVILSEKGSIPLTQMITSAFQDLADQSMDGKSFGKEIPGWSITQLRIDQMEAQVERTKLRLTKGYGPRHKGFGEKIRDDFEG